MVLFREQIIVAESLEQIPVPWHRYLFFETYIPFQEFLLYLGFLVQILLRAEEFVPLGRVFFHIV